MVGVLGNWDILLIKYNVYFIARNHPTANPSLGSKCAIRRKNAMPETYFADNLVRTSRCELMLTEFWIT